ncbi:MAG TPA: sigma 54-interacting transcriptional regulator [Steroidobacteraceae bacterium]|jgi:two-component system response regulator GlrR|nr:sigma 54-interacting transcriptional regulator [Steroidobacteraceae bacterium]
MKPKAPIPTTSLGFGIMGKPKESLRTGSAEEPARKVKVLVVDNDSALRRSVGHRLSPSIYAVEAAGGAHAALDACVRSRPNLVITELRLNDMDGITFLKELKSRWPQLVVIIVTAHGSIAQAVQATQHGAFSYLVEPVEKEELLGHVQRGTAISTFALTDENWRAHFASRNQLMEERLGLANRAAESDEPVLLTGENGTGKELLARAIHAASTRRDEPFAALSCRNASEEDLRVASPAPVDGAEAGAPGAGAFARARGGTLLLDEIGELPMNLQAALAKMLEPDPTIHASSAARVGVRLICTTSVDLRSLTESGQFSSQLYYQINIMAIEIPPLGRRREDIPLLVSHFLEQATEAGGQRKIYSAKAIELLATHDWPGNVRQLFELVKENVAMSHGRVMTKEFVEQFLDGGSARIPSYEEARDSFSRDYLVKNMQQTAGNVTQAARLAKRNRTDFYNLLARYRLYPEDFKGDRTGRKPPDQSSARDASQVGPAGGGPTESDD